MSKADKKALYVGGLDGQVTEQGLYTAFVPFGPIKSVQIPLDYHSQRGKGFGFVEFDEEADARAAIDNMDDSELFGRTLRVAIAKPDRPKLGSNKPVWAETDETMGAAQAPTYGNDKPQA
ncbi:Peptidyl-prolyl cis-trans isomerase E [Phytophthora megakarya]|uniref:Peptidyl-prolyl cis-trans isomerase E n=1 Tax=Phytophthora megakarya TaxID=4795 RepID=A0A225X417_9STRA|nr:Peptidyl-prolyl cis-trans isomerase E [Phytophthora megakarya]